MFGKDIKRPAFVFEYNVSQYFFYFYFFNKWWYLAESIVWIFIFLIWRASHFTFSEVHCVHIWPLYIMAMNNFRVKKGSMMHQVTWSSSCLAISPSQVLNIKDKAWETAVQKKKRQWSHHFAPQWSITGYACRVMNTFHFPTRPLTQGHVETVALGPLRRADSYTVTVLKGLHWDTNAPRPVRKCVWGRGLHWTATHFFSCHPPHWKKRDQPFRSAGGDLIICSETLQHENRGLWRGETLVKIVSQTTRDPSPFFTPLALLTLCSETF